MPDLRPFLSILLTVSLGLPGASQNPPTAPKYKLTVIEEASTAKRVRKGRVSSQAVVKITDENDIPVPGIVVAFTIPNLTGGGAAFANGTLTSVITTNAAGVASSGSFAAASGTTFSVSVSASVPGGVLTASVPATSIAAAGAGGAAGGAAGAGAGGGISTGLLVGIIAGVGAAAGIGAAVGLGGGGGSGGGGGGGGGGTTIPRGTIGGPGSPTFGPPR